MGDGAPGAAMAPGARRIELASAAILSLAAVGSSWCGYQATHWSGTQMEAFGRANAAHIDATRESMRMQVLAAIDVNAFVGWLDARLRGDPDTAMFLEHRFRPAFTPAFSAWMAEQPFERADATRTPFARPEYRLESQAQLELEAESRTQTERSLAANAYTESYVLKTVLFALVMLFGGLAPRFQAHGLRVVMLTIAAGSLAFAIGNLVLFVTG